eukprot:Skav223265  [mRNA]  locus=scaffold1037:286491:287738:- [translate_table: standard]
MGMTCENFKKTSPDSCDYFLEYDGFGWGPEVCCSPVPLTCSNLDCPHGTTLIPNLTTVCSTMEEGCTANDCCQDLESCNNYDGCVRSDEKIADKLCDSSGCTRDVCCQSSPYTRPCLCDTEREGLHCETGQGRTCAEGDNKTLYSCSVNGSLCVAQSPCHPKPGITQPCEQYRTKDTCEGHVHCQYSENTNIVHTWGCQAIEQGTIEDYCRGVTDPEKCDEQLLCTWNLLQVAEGYCKNGGTWQGCVGQTDAAAARCRLFAHDECLANNDVCSWQGRCQCVPSYFGKDCAKQVAVFNAQAPQGICAEQQADKAVCNGLIYASSNTDRHLCAEEGMQCGPWQNAKLAVSRIRAAEIGDIIVDSLGIVLLMLAACFRFNHVSKYVFVASLANFIADLCLEATLVVVSGEARVVSTPN